MKKYFDKIKTFVDVYKIWIFIAALFGTNGLQAYFNDSGTTKGSAPKIANVTKPKLISVCIPVVCNCIDGTKSHVDEHHGGIR